MSDERPTPDEQRELDAVDSGLSGRAVDPELEDVAALARELRDTRARPSPAYAARLDREVARSLRSGGGRRPRRVWWRVAVPAAAAVAAVAIALVVPGGDDDSRRDGGLELAVVQSEGDAGGLEAAPQTAPRSDEPGGQTGSFALVARRVLRGDPLVVEYFYPRPTAARVSLAGRSGEIELGPGAGRLEVSTEGVDPGIHHLRLEIGPLPAVRERVEVVEPG